jgi:xanthine dehydrogenase small subunit
MTHEAFELNVILNGQRQKLRCTSSTQTLLHALNSAGLVGTKEGCGDGDCGACTVVVMRTFADGTQKPFAVNSCLIPVAQMQGKVLITVEGVAETCLPRRALFETECSIPQTVRSRTTPVDAFATLHPVQQAMVRCAGSQCGYCTPGFVMSLFADFHANKQLNEEVVEGNLCRCTGYSSIRRAMAELRGLASFDLPAPATRPTSLGSVADSDRFYTPKSLQDALELKAKMPNARWLAGATDIGLELSRDARHPYPLIAIDQLAELQGIRLEGEFLELGAALTLSDLKAALESELAGSEWQVLRTMLHWFAAMQVRNRATIGGNIGTASPIGDLLPALLALDAEVELRSLRGGRWIALAEYFLAYRKTALAVDELISTIRVPRAKASIKRLSSSYKVGKRGSDDISIVAASFVLDVDAAGRIVHARLAYGGIAATPIRALAVESLLIGARIQAALSAEVLQALSSAFSPLSDFRGSAAYRCELIVNLYRKFINENCLSS